jgi:hypothetical protein
MIGLHPQHLVSEVIRPTLYHMGERYATPAAQQLLLGTALVESDGLRALHQYANGPGRGLWQMEPATLNDHYKWLAGHPELLMKIAELRCIAFTNLMQLSGNLYYACAMARVHYWRVLEPLPEANNISGLALYWKTYYNTPDGKGTVSAFVIKWHEATQDTRG